MPTEPAGISALGVSSLGRYQSLGEATQVRKSGRKAHHIDEVVGARVELYHFVGRQARVLGDELEVGGVLPLVKRRNLHGPGRARRALTQVALDLSQPVLQVGVGDLHRVVLHQQRPVGRQQVDNAGDVLPLDGPHQVVHPAVDLWVDGVAQLDHDGLVACRQEVGGLVQEVFH